MIAKAALPPQFSREYASGVEKGEPVAQFEIGDHENFVYLVIDWKNRHALIVDPQEDLRPLLDAFREYSLTPRGVLLTHTHFDHIAGVPGLLEHFPELPVHVNKEDQHRLDRKVPSQAALRLVEDNQVLPFGDLQVRVLHTPGHSPGECCYQIEGARIPYLLTGDTVFILDCGRTDLQGGSTTQMFDSLQRIRKLTAETVILPGHHYKPQCASTLGAEIEKSPPFRCRSVAELEALP